MGRNYIIRIIAKDYIVYIKGFDSYTTPSQQLHNNPSHEGDPSVWGSSSCEGFLCSYCISVVNLTFSIYKSRVLI
jgi:hypothetical protein